MSLEQKIDTEKIENYVQALKRVTTTALSDELPDETVDLIFIHARPLGDDDPIITYAANLVKSGRAKNILIPGNDGQREGGSIRFESSGGRSEIARKLDSLEIDINEQLWFTGPDSLNTRTETTALFEFVLTHNCKTIGLVGYPHLLPRIMLGTVAQLNKLNLYLPVYLTHPTKTDWDEVVPDNQGGESKPRREHILGELKKIPRYQKPKGQETSDLATFDELAPYFEKRGSLNKRLQELVLSDYRLIESQIDLLTPEDIFPS